LRIATPSLNSHNVPKRVGQSSKYRGVCISKNKKSWVVQCCGQNMGRFKTEVAAAYAYNLEAVKVFGADACTNDVEKPEDFAAQHCKHKIMFTANLPRYVKRKKDYFVAHITVDGKQKTFGHFVTPEAAAEKAQELRRNYARKLEDDHARRQITRNSEGTAVIHTFQGPDILVDGADWHILSKRAWSITRAGYASGSNVLMHRFLLENVRPDQMVDHISGNTIDNRRSNLRITDAAGNSHNRRIRHSRFRGIKIHRKKYQASITHSGRFYTMGSYVDECVAVHAWNNKAAELVGENAMQQKVQPVPSWMWDSASSRMVLMDDQVDTATQVSNQSNASTRTS